jgi:hypothetical protein
VVDGAVRTTANGVRRSGNTAGKARATAIMTARSLSSDRWSPMSCHACEKNEDQTRLTKCSVCHRSFCDEHRYVMSGRSFCSQRCAQYFFFADPEDD